MFQMFSATQQMEKTDFFAFFRFVFAFFSLSNFICDSSQFVCWLFIFQTKNLQKWNGSLSLIRSKVYVSNWTRQHLYLELCRKHFCEQLFWTIDNRYSISTHLTQTSSFRFWYFISGWFSMFRFIWGGKYSYRHCQWLWVSGYSLWLNLESNWITRCHTYCIE